MPDRFSTSAGAVCLDGPAAIECLRGLARNLLDSHPDVQAVYLFGSLAQNRHAPGSDADLLIVLAHDERRFVDRVPEFLRAFLQTPLPVDLFPFTVQELAEKQQQGNFFVQQALQGGILLDARQGYRGADPTPPRTRPAEPVIQRTRTLPAL